MPTEKEILALSRQLVGAATEGDFKKINELVHKGADIHMDSDMVLDVAIGYGYPDLFWSLVWTYEFDLKNNFRALREAVQFEYLDIVKFLIEDCGMAVDIEENVALKTVIQYAKNTEVLEYLVSKGADITETEYDGFTYQTSLHANNAILFQNFTSLNFVLQNQSNQDLFFRTENLLEVLPAYLLPQLITHHNEPIYELFHTILTKYPSVFAEYFLSVVDDTAIHNDTCRIFFDKLRLDVSFGVSKLNSEQSLTSHQQNAKTVRKI